VAEISAALRFGAGFLAAGAVGADGGASEAAASRLSALMLGFLTVGAAATGGGASEAAASRLSALALGFLTAGAVTTGGGATTRVALRLAPRPRRGGADGAEAGWSGATSLLRFGMGFQPTILGPDVVYSTVQLRRLAGVACDVTATDFVFFRRTRALPGTKVAHLVME
jgi:hypothetical protein